MGKGVKEKIANARLRKNQRSNLMGEYYAESYKEVKDGITYIRTRWIRKKPKKVKK